MTIHLPKDVEDSICAEIQSGHFASADEAIAAAWRAYLERRLEQAGVTEPAASKEPPAPARKPIWEVFQEIAASIPDEEWAKMPADASEQHDHYIYGTPKRSSDPDR